MKKRTGFITALSLVTRVRLVRSDYEPDYTKTGFYLPFIGLGVSVLVFGVYYALSRFIPDPFITVFLLLGIQYFLFNLFHFDGLLDTADALSCFAEREKRLVILKDVHTGAFALFVGGLYLAAKLYFLTKTAVYFHILDLPPLSFITVVFIFFSYPVSGRGAAAMVPVFLKPARDNGLGALLKDSPAVFPIIGVFISHCIPAVLVVFSFLFSEGIPLLFFLAYAACLLALIVTVLLYGRKIGGFTGDTLGFAVEIGELIHIFIFYLFLLFPTVSGL